MWSKLRAPWALAVLTSAGLLAPSSSAEAGKPKLLVLPYQHMEKGMPDDLGEQTTVVVTREISVGNITVIREADLGGAAPKARSSGPKFAPTGNPKAGIKAEKLLTQGQEYMDEGEFETAVRKIEKAIKLLEENGDAVPDLRLLAECYLQLGVAYFRDGMEDEGDDALTKAIHYDPKR